MLKNPLLFFTGVFVGSFITLFKLHPPGGTNSADWAYWVQAAAAVLGFIGLFAVVFLQRSQQIADRKATAAGVQTLLQGVSRTSESILDDVIATQPSSFASQAAADNFVSAGKRRLQAISERVSNLPFPDVVQASCLPQSLVIQAIADDAIAHLAFTNLYVGLTPLQRQTFDALRDQFHAVEARIAALQK